MFSKVLIANRGEIACRIIRACKHLGIGTVAIYSDADKQALHVQMADEAYRIGPASAQESYLRMDRIIGIAKKVKADAIHPGYGFLSENPIFVRAVEAADIAFVGPSAGVIARLGDKVVARQLAKEAGVPVIPGTDRSIDDAEAINAAKVIGYPLLVKAVGGGGGLGIRSVNEEQELLPAVTAARNQAQNAFNNPRIYLERNVSNPSHVEVQIAADHHGNVIHLFERDCSVQRRHQKIIEETPCVKLSTAQRKEITDAAAKMAKHVGYTNLGTIEFLLDENGQFYFLEVNTRLQVEHPITEMITGLDLVALQLQIAAGETLPFSQDAVKSRGHAIEARVYPEDPVTFLPTAGTINNLIEPSGDRIRVDSSLYPGYKILSYYEPLMSKVIVWGEDRHQALETMRKALDSYHLGNITSNIPAINRALSHATFVSGAYSTHFLEHLGEELVTGNSGKEQIAAIAVAIAISQDRAIKEWPSKWKQHGRRQAMVNRLDGGPL